MAGGNKGNALQTKLKGDILSYPVAIATAIHRGCMVGVNAAGFAVMATDTASTFFAGIAEEAITAVQAVANGTVNVKVRRRGIFKMVLATTGAAPSLNGDIVYVDTTQTASVDEKVDVAANVANHILVGKIVKHGTLAEAVAGSNSTEVWIDIMGMQDTANSATYQTVATAASHVAGAGAELTGVEASSGFGATPTVQDALEALIANGQIAVPLTAFTEEDGTILTVTADGTIGFKQVGNEETVLQVAAAEVIAATVGLPDDFNGAVAASLELVVVKNGTDADDATINLEAYAAATGAAINSATDAYAGAAEAITNNTNIQILTFALAAAQLPDAARTLTIILTPVGTDEIYILGAAIKYTRDLS